MYGLEEALDVLLQQSPEVSATFFGSKQNGVDVAGNK
jgi:hypothetical protein